MLIEIFRSGVVDSRPSSKCRILFVCLFVCVGAGDASSPTIQMPEMDDYWMGSRRTGV